MTKCAAALSAENKADKAALVIKNYLDYKGDDILNYSVKVKQKLFSLIDEMDACR